MMMAFNFQYARTGTPKLLKFGTNFVQKANITGRGTRGCRLVLPEPFPYEDKRLRLYHLLFDSTFHRITEENAKIIVVEGPIAVGKTALAKALAEEFDMLYKPQVTLDDYYVLPSGFDLRQNDHLIPRILQSYDHKDFCTNPYELVKATFYQYNMLQLRFNQYVDALAHVLNTGQGVVLERSFFSDYVFSKAMYENKFISKAGYDFYMEMVTNTIPCVINPHLIVYLDIPVPVVQERIRTRNYSYEQNSPALTKEYLTSLDKYWKQYLLQQQKKSEILVYDWTNGGEVELIVEDIEQLNLDNATGEPFVEWRKRKRDWETLRLLYTNDKFSFDEYFKIRIDKVPEFDLPGYLFNQSLNAYKYTKEGQYDIGYNTAMGDSFLRILFDTRMHKHRQPRRYVFMNVN